MAHMGLGPGTAHIFDEVDKSDFGSEFPVGSTLDSHWLLTHHSPLPRPACLHPFVSCPVCWNDSPCDGDAILTKSLCLPVVVVCQASLTAGCIAPFEKATKLTGFDTFLSWDHPLWGVWGCSFIMIIYIWSL